MTNLKLTLLLLAAAGSALSSSCATARGFGQDLQKVGNKLENQADSTGGAAPVQSTGTQTPAPASNIPPAY